MKRIILKEFRIEKYDKTCSKRTRPMITYKCTRCNQEYTEIKKKDCLDKYCGNCECNIKATPKYLEEATKKYGNTFDLSKIFLTHTTDKITVTCLKHNHTYEISRYAFIGKGYGKDCPQKGGCKYCAIEASKEYLHKDINYYLQFLYNRFPQFTVVEHGNACSNTEKITLNCPQHGIFTTTLAKLVSNKSVYLCPTCNTDLNAWRMRTTRTDVKGYVYHLYLPELGKYKIGVTYRPIEKRMKEISNSSRLLWLVELETLADAYLLEYCLLQINNSTREILTSSEIGGYTEFFNSKIKKPTKAFIKEILYLKESNSGELLKFKTILSEACKNLQERATTIPTGSTLQANGSGNGSNLTE